MIDRSIEQSPKVTIYMPGGEVVQTQPPSVAKEPVQIPPEHEIKEP